MSNAGDGPSCMINGIPVVLRNLIPGQVIGFNGVYWINTVGGGGGYPPDNVTLSLNGSNQMQIKLSNGNTWTATQTFSLPIKNNTASTTLTGTTAGTIVWSQPEQGTSIKAFIANAIGYENATGAAQTISFPTAFTHTPIIVGNDTGMVLTVSTTTLTLPTGMGGVVNGNIYIVGA